MSVNIEEIDEYPESVESRDEAKGLLEHRSIEALVEFLRSNIKEVDECFESTRLARGLVLKKHI